MLTRCDLGLCCLLWLRAAEDILLIHLDTMGCGASATVAIALAKTVVMPSIRVRLPAQMRISPRSQGAKKHNMGFVDLDVAVVLHSAVSQTLDASTCTGGASVT